LSAHTRIALNHAPYVLRLWVPGGLSDIVHGDAPAPFILRMIERLNSNDPALSQAYRKGLRIFVRQRWVSTARTALLFGRRRDAIRILREATHYGIDKRWLLTSLMAVAVPGKIVAAWQHWRVMRKMIVK
jgi:hypothetical protein